MNRALHRPEPMLHPTAHPIDRNTHPGKAAARLRAGETLMLTDFYGTGEDILAELEVQMPPPPESASYAARHRHRRELREASLRLLAPIQHHRLALQDWRPIGYFQELYPDLSRFYLPFIQVQELHGAWIRYQEGVQLAVLGHRLHPYFGTYLPNRVLHLELFGTWLSQYQGIRERAIDVGTGCGVLALMLARAGFERVLATDMNPNAIESVKRDLERLRSPPPIDLRLCDLLGEAGPPADVIVFNPPWIRGEATGLLDTALYFQEGLFERFFDQACGRLTPQGRVVLIFSNVMELVQPDVDHPIKQELLRGRLRLVQKLQRRVKPVPTETGERRRTRERVEVWELART